MCPSLGGTEVVLVMALYSVVVKVLVGSAKLIRCWLPSAFGGQREVTSEGQAPTCAQVMWEPV